MIGNRRNLAESLAHARERFESRMRGKCRIERVTGTEVDDHGRETVTTEVVYEGKDYVTYDGVPFESTFDSAGVSVIQGRVELVVPVGTDARADDVVTILSDPDSPDLAGADFRIASEVPRSQGTRKRLLLEDNQKGVRTNA